MSWLNLENVKATKRRLFSASGTRHPERKWCRMNSAVCLCVCIDPTVTTSPPVLLQQHILSFQPECVCIFQHDWHLCESNPCSTTLTWWTLLIQVYCHSFLAAPIGSDLPPFRVKRDANRKSFSHLTDSLFLMLSFCSPAVSLILLGHLVVLRMAEHLECDCSGPPSAV